MIATASTILHPKSGGRLPRHMRHLVAGGSAIALALGVVPATAQTVNGGNIPLGSPLDPTNSGQSPSQDGTNQNQGQGANQNQGQNGVNGSQSTIYEPVSVNRSSSTTQDDATNNNGNTNSNANTNNNGARVGENGLLDLDSLKLRKPAKPGEFETWARQVTGRDLKRFGNDLLLPGSRDFAMPATSTIPPDYALNIGDTVSISLTGSVEGSADTQIDRDGNIFLPNVGTISLLGVHYRDLRDRIATAVGRKYRGYEVSVSIARLRGVRVYVTGFANHPGAYSVNSLSTLVNAVLQAGGPSSGGSFRSVKLYRRGSEVADFDIYQLVRGGNRINDAVLQNEDVLFIPPTGPQVAVIGSVNEEAIYETRPGETLDTVLAIAGGTNDFGDPGRIILYRTAQTDRLGPIEIRREAMASSDAMGGDILQILSRGSLVQPIDRQSVLVRVEGEVNRPGNYYVPPNTPMSQVMALAGGLTSRAYAFGTKLIRQSVRAQQRESFSEAIKQFELSLAAAPIIADRSIDATTRQAQLAGARAVLDRLRQAEPDGRVVLDIAPAANVLPSSLLLENNDQITVPARSSTVGVFGAVYRPASFLIDVPGQRPMRVKDYIDRAGGPLRAADQREVFVVRANGAVLSRKRGALNAYVYPGDVVFVPIKTQSTDFWARLRDVSTTLFQVGLAAATVGAIK